MTAAIGDGANDVSMIQEAHIGLGIYGKEGNMASLSADFAFSKFKYLRRALLVHGHLYYTRVALLVQYFFYKNLAFILCAFYYTFYSAFSVKSLFNSLYLNLYNTVYTSIPIIFYGLFEQPYNLNKLQSDSKFYKKIADNSELSVSYFIKWTLFGIWHSIIAYFFAFLFNNGPHFTENGTLNDHTGFGLQIATIVTIIVHFKLILEWNYWSTMFFIGNLASFIACLGLNILPNSIIVPSFLTFITDDQNFYWIFFDMLSHVSYWLLIFLSIVASLVPDICFKILENAIKLKKILNEVRSLNENNCNSITSSLKKKF